MNTSKLQTKNKKQLKILTWHVHGNYLYYLTQVPFLFYLPVASPKKPGYFGKTNSFSWGDNVREIAAGEVKNLDVDCIIFQSNFDPQDPFAKYITEQIEILSDYQLRYVPKLFVEHDPPRLHPTDTKHILYNSPIPLIHVTHFNQLMWDSGTTQTTVIDHGVTVPRDAHYSGEVDRGVVVVNNLSERGRRLGADIFAYVRKKIPLDLIGIGSKNFQGLGEVSPHELPYAIAKYRFLFHPARYTSLGLTVIEAMMTGLPIVGFATTELPTVITNDVNGYVHTDVDYLIEKMNVLLSDKALAKRLGEHAKKTAQKRFGIQRFIKKWKSLIANTSLQFASGFGRNYYRGLFDQL